MILANMNTGVLLFSVLTETLSFDFTSNSLYLKLSVIRYKKHFFGLGEGFIETLLTYFEFNNCCVRQFG